MINHLLMKTLRIALIIPIMLAAASCGNNDDPANSASAVENAVKAGTWKITRFEDSGNNETSMFSGYNFAFDASGTLTASNGGNIFIGSWSVIDGKSDDGNDNSNDMHFNIDFNLNNYFEELSEDWRFVSYGPSKIELIHVSGGNGGTDYLTFERK
jgi:hypothetical protein